MSHSLDHRLGDVFDRWILDAWGIYSRDEVLFHHQLAGLHERHHIFYTHQMVSSTERMSIDRAPYKVRFTPSPYKHAFLRRLDRVVLPMHRIEMRYAIEEFCYYCLENIYQHAGTKGYALLDASDEEVLLAFFDKGPGIADINNDKVPDIIEAIKPKTSLVPIGSKGMGLTKAIRQADNFHLYTNGYSWRKSEPGRVCETPFRIRGVCIVARISLGSAIRQPRRYMMI